MVIHSDVFPFACDTGTVLAASLSPTATPGSPTLGLEFAVFLMGNIFSVTLAELCELSLLGIKGASPQQEHFLSGADL